MLQSNIEHCEVNITIKKQMIDLHNVTSLYQKLGPLQNVMSFLGYLVVCTGSCVLLSYCVVSTFAI
jgi:hypothetical protein